MMSTWLRSLQLLGGDDTTKQGLRHHVASSEHTIDFCDHVVD